MTYSPERFKALVEEFAKREAAILEYKAGEYANCEDRLQNFHEQAVIQGMPPAEIALTYFLKHVLSIAKAVRNSGSQQWVWTTENGTEGLKQRFADARNYLLLMAACIDEEESKCQ